MKISFYWLRLAGSALLIVWIVYLLDWQALLQQLSRVSITLFVLALIVNATGTVLARALLVWSLVERPARPPLSKVIEVFFSLRFFSIALPKPVVVGLRINRLNKLFGKNVYFAIGLMSYEALTGALIMALGAVLFFLIETDNISWSPLSLYVFLTALGLLLAFLALFTRKLDFILRWLLKLPLPGNSLRAALEARLEQWRGWVNEHIARDQSALWSTLVFALIFYLGFILSGYILFLAMGESLPFSAIAWTRSAVWMITVLPISIGGLGVREAGFAYVMADYGIGFELAVAYGLMSFILQTSIGLLGAGIELKNAVLNR